MQELLRNAWQGWQQYISAGKVAALLLAVLLWYWFGRSREQEKQGTLYHYTTLMSILCICPVTAVCLQLYQTKFYDYQWIWSFVPVTLVIAYGGTTFLAKNWEQWKEKTQERVKIVTVTALCAGALLLCGSLGKDTGLEYIEAEAETEELLELLLERQDGEVCLWAPREVMSKARALNGKIKLVYGRNMWDKSLDGYAYDTYTEAEKELYEWMCVVETQGDTEEKTAKYADMAGDKGVNTLLLPIQIEEQLLRQMESATGAVAEEVGAYYLLCW